MQQGSYNNRYFYFNIWRSGFLEKHRKLHNHSNAQTSLKRNQRGILCLTYQKAKNTAKRTAVALVPLNFKGPTFCHFTEYLCYNRSLTEEEYGCFHGNFRIERDPSSCFCAMKGNKGRGGNPVCVRDCVKRTRWQGGARRRGEGGRM